MPAKYIKTANNVIKTVSALLNMAVTTFKLVMLVPITLPVAPWHKRFFVLDKQRVSADVAPAFLSWVGALVVEKEHKHIFL